MPFRVKTHQIYFSREKFLSDKTPSWGWGGFRWSCKTGCVTLTHAVVHPVFFPCWTSTKTHRNDDKARTAEFDSPSLTEVGALDDPEVTLAAEGARGEIGGGICRGGAFFLVPHHCHHSAVVQAVHGEVPEAPLLEGQGRGRGEQPDRTEPQQQGVMWPHR